LRERARERGYQISGERSELINPTFTIEN